MNMSERGKEIIVSEEDIEFLKDKVTDNPGTIAYPHHIGSIAIKPEDKGKIKGRAVAAMYEQTDSQLNQISEQVKLLAAQAKAIQDRIKVSERIYQANMSFEPLIGKEYYLYLKKDGKDTLSMVAPEEWGSTIAFPEFVARVKLLSDHTWEVQT